MQPSKTILPYDDSPQVARWEF